MLIEHRKIDKIEIIENNIQIREVVTILKDEIEIASSYHRSLYKLGDDISNLDPKIQAIASIIWQKDSQQNISGSVP